HCSSHHCGLGKRQCGARGPGRRERGHTRVRGFRCGHGPHPARVQPDHYPAEPGAMNMMRSPPSSMPIRQRGVALVVALVLLLVVTVIGLASMRGTSLQERMSANMFDRSLSFQRAEGALRAAEDAITGNWQITTLGGEDCSGTTDCVNAGTTAFTAGGTDWTDSAEAFVVNDERSP